jgi:tetratricopeptide (TPR) repeat protein
MTQRKVDERQARKLLRSAVATRARGDVEKAIGVFQALMDMEFPYRDIAWQQYAICLQETRQYEQAEQELVAWLQQYTDRTVPRAYSLRHLAEVLNVQGRIQEAEKFIQEAIEIFEANREFFNLGMMFQLKAALETRHGDLPRALERLEEGREMIEAYQSTSSQSQQRSAAQPITAGV